MKMMLDPVHFQPDPPQESQVLLKPAHCSFGELHFYIRKKEISLLRRISIESDPSGGAGQKREQSTLEDPMEIKDKTIAFFPETRYEPGDLPDRSPDPFRGLHSLFPPLSGKEDHPIDLRLAFQESSRRLLHHPGDMGGREILLKGLDRGKGPKDVSHRAQP